MLTVLTQDVAISRLVNWLVPTNVDKQNITDRKGDSARVQSAN